MVGDQETGCLLLFTAQRGSCAINTMTNKNNPQRKKEKQQGSYPRNNFEFRLGLNKQKIFLLVLKLRLLIFLRYFQAVRYLAH